MRVIFRFLFLLGILLGIYGCAYAVLSFNGSYVSSQTGMARMAHGGALVSDVSVWRPKFVRLRISLGANSQIEREANFLGWLFYLLELLDRRYWHPTKHLFLDILKGIPREASPGGSSVP